MTTDSTICTEWEKMEPLSDAWFEASVFDRSDSLSFANVDDLYLDDAGPEELRMIEEMMDDLDSDGWPPFPLPPAAPPIRLEPPKPAPPIHLEPPKPAPPKPESSDSSKMLFSTKLFTVGYNANFSFPKKPEFKCKCKCTCQELPRKKRKYTKRKPKDKTLASKSPSKAPPKKKI
jgi:hypothetical protein